MQLRGYCLYPPPPEREVPPISWETNPPTQQKLAKFLSESAGNIPSVVGVRVDSILITSIFGQHGRKAPNRRHDLKYLVPSPPKIDPAIQKQIHEGFDRLKESLGSTITDVEYLEKVDSFGRTLSELEVFNGNGQDVFRVLSWTLTAYSSMLSKDSPVKLRTITKAGQLQFGVFAKTNLKKGAYIYELMGVTAADTEAVHFHPSEICLHPAHKNGDDIKIWFGPARFVDHNCHGSNVEIAPIPNTSAYTMYTTADINEGEEIYRHYGKDYLEDLPDGCSCQSCFKETSNAEMGTTPSESSSKRKAESSEEAAAERKRSKRAKNRQNRKLGRQNGKGGT